MEERVAMIDFVLRHSAIVAAATMSGTNDESLYIYVIGIIHFILYILIVFSIDFVYHFLVSSYL